MVTRLKDVYGDVVKISGNVHRNAGAVVYIACQCDGEMVPAVLDAAGVEALIADLTARLAGMRSEVATEETLVACQCGSYGCTGPGDERHQCGGPKEACGVVGCDECRPTKASR